MIQKLKFRWKKKKKFIGSMKSWNFIEKKKNFFLVQKSWNFVEKKKFFWFMKVWNFRWKKIFFFWNSKKFKKIEISLKKKINFMVQKSCKNKKKNFWKIFFFFLKKSWNFLEIKYFFFIQKSWNFVEKKNFRFKKVEISLKIFFSFKKLKFPWNKFFFFV